MVVAELRTSAGARACPRTRPESAARRALLSFQESLVADRVHWQPYGGQPSGSRLIRMAPWFDDGSLSVHMSARYYWQDAAEAHRVVEQGHTRGKLVLIVDDDLAAALEV